MQPGAKMLIENSVTDSGIYSDEWKIPLATRNLQSWEGKYVNGQIHSILL